MKVEIVAEPKEIPEPIGRVVVKEVSAALNGVRTAGAKFIVNNTLWFALNDKQKITPCVMNNAGFISGNFLDALSNINWKKEHGIDGQSIDAYKEFDQSDYELYSIPRDRFCNFFGEYLATDIGRADVDAHEHLDFLFRRLYGTYVRRSAELKSNFPSALSKFFSRETTDRKLRVGLEFETGNIASSFRALMKLSVLFVADQIDAGVFITSIDKRSASTEIWPVSNRNGSFQELKQRHYRRFVELPLWEIGFAPDGFSQEAQYLGKKSLYNPVKKGNPHTYGGITYDPYRRPDGKAVLKPRGLL